MLTEILDQWEVLVELQRQQNTWQQRWDRAQAEFQRALQQLDPHDADRLARVLGESLPTPLPISNPTPTNALVGSLSDNAPVSAGRTPVATPPRPSATPTPVEPATATSTTTAPQPVAVDTRPSIQSSTQAPTPSSMPSPAEVHGQTPSPLTAAVPEPQAVADEPMIDEAAIFASDDAFFGSITADESPAMPIAEEPAQAAASPPATDPTPAQLDLLQWATETIGDGVTENELFQAMRKSPFAGQARQLFELLRERDAFYETADEVIHVHSLKKIAEFQNT